MHFARSRHEWLLKVPWGYATVDDRIATAESSIPRYQAIVFPTPLVTRLRSALDRLGWSAEWLLTRLDMRLHIPGTRMVNNSGLCGAQRMGR